MTKKNNLLGYYVVSLAAIIIVLAGLKSATSILVPFLLSLFIAIILSPFYTLLKNKKVPEALALIIVLISLVVTLVLLGVVIGSSLQDFSQNIPMYEAKLNTYLVSFNAFLANIGIVIPEQDLSTFFDPHFIFSYVASTLKGMGSFLTNSFVILLTVAFLLLESSQFSEKFSNDGAKNKLVQLDNIIDKIKHYMALKTIISFATGIIVFVILSIIGLDYAILWGLLAFLLNFIPNIGSIIAAVPAVLLSVVQFGPFMALIVAVIFMLINTIIGSIIEPKVMGKGLGLSTLIVFLSLIFWGWLLGPVGMLLSIPLTIMFKIIFHEYEETKWISTLLGDSAKS